MKTKRPKIILRMKNTLILLFIFSSFSMIAQDIDEDVMINKSVPGYIITNIGDTINGRVKVQNRAKNQVKVKFTKEGTRKEKSYKPKDIKGYGYQTFHNNNATQKVRRDRHFLKKTADQPPVPFSSKNVFMEVKAQGKAILYSFYKQNNSNVESTYTHYYFLEFQDGSRERKITKDDFDWAVPAFLEDCPKISNLISTQLGYSKLEQIVNIYNNCENYSLDDCDECALEGKQADQVEKGGDEQ